MDNLLLMSIVGPGRFGKKTSFFLRLHRSAHLLKTYIFMGYQPLIQQKSEKSEIELKQRFDFGKNEQLQNRSQLLDDSCAENYGEKEAGKIFFARKHKVFFVSFLTKIISSKLMTVHKPHQNSSLCLVKTDVQLFLIDWYENFMKRTSFVAII